jgi:PAS domain S-box-containing protein
MNLGGEMHLLTLIQDITERKKAEEELRKLSQAVEQSPVSVAITNIHGEIEYVNPKFTEITGYSKEEAIGQNPRILKSGEMPAEKHTQLWQTISSGKAWFGEFQNTKKNGESYWEMASISPIVDPAGNITHYLVIKEDITDRKLYEKALLDSERKYRVVADNTYNWEFWSDTEGNYIYCSPSCIRITGYSAQEFIDNQKLRIEIVHPDYKTEFSNHILNENTSTKGSSTQFKIIHKNGTIRWIEHICQPVFDNNDNYLGQRGSNRDITDNKETERRILKAIISTEEKERNIFSQDLHDGLGPMLSTIKLYFEWLAETKDADKRKRITKTSLDNINDAIQAVRDISNKLSPRILNNLGLISAMKNLIQKLNKTQKIKINLSFDIERRYNTQLEVTLYRIFSELINNTLKYADAQNIEIKITHDIENERIFVVYNDDGKGFNLEDVMKPNKGLGIQNIKQRIKTLDGKIIFDTDYGKPLSVNIELPIANMNNE